MIFYLKSNLSLKRTNFKVIFKYDLLFLRYQWFKFGIFFHTFYNNPRGLMGKSQNLTPPISPCQHQHGTFIQFFLSFYHKNYAFLIDTFESKNNWYLNGYKYLAKFWFYVLLIVFKSSQNQFHFFLFTRFFYHSHIRKYSNSLKMSLLYSKNIKYFYS